METFLLLEMDSYEPTMGRMEGEDPDPPPLFRTRKWAVLDRINGRMDGAIKTIYQGPPPAEKWAARERKKPCMYLLLVHRYILNVPLNVLCNYAYLKHETFLLCCCYLIKHKIEEVKSTAA